LSPPNTYNVPFAPPNTYNVAAVRMLADDGATDT
jgi:hypothetical protein